MLSLFLYFCSLSIWCHSKFFKKIVRRQGCFTSLAFAKMYIWIQKSLPTRLTGGAIFQSKVLISPTKNKSILKIIPVSLLRLSFRDLNLYWISNIRKYTCACIWNRYKNGKKKFTETPNVKICHYCHNSYFLCFYLSCFSTLIEIQTTLWSADIQKTNNHYI